MSASRVQPSAWEKRLEVIDHEPAFWFLLGDGHRLFLDVNCSHSVVAYDFLMELDESERALQRSQGHAYVSQLAETIRTSAPGVRDSASRYEPRNIASDYRTQVLEAIKTWRAQQDEQTE